MRICVLIAIATAMVLPGCTTARCDKVEPYQKTVATQPLKVPSDLSEPPLRSRAPDVGADVQTKRADGKCLELPPPYEPDTNPS